MTTHDLDHQTEYSSLSAANSSEQPSREVPSDSPSPPNNLRRNGFFLLNVFLAFHLFAIVVCPASVEPSSPLLQSSFGFVSPYLHFLYLDHGFHFFVPDPGASTLVAYEAELPDGSTKSGRFPNSSIYPRLLYHRFFMLSEYLGNGPENVQPLVERAFARNLCRETGAVRVTLTRIVHELATEQEVRSGMTLNDPALFKETALGTFTAEELRETYTPRAKMNMIHEEPEYPEKIPDEPRELP
jgi:hypothetical protein